MNIVILNRWDDEFSRYDNYVDHGNHSVAYLTTVSGLRYLPVDSARVVAMVEDMNDLACLDKAFRRILGTLGTVDRILALSEFDLLNAAQLRERFAVPGPDVAEVSRFRDKCLMKRHVSAAGLKVPTFVQATSPQQAFDFAERVGFPVVVKPRFGAASVGVCVAKDSYELERALGGVAWDDLELERYIEGDIYHVDGLVDCKGIAFANVSAYVGTCLDFAQGHALGSYTLAPSDLHARLLDFAERCLGALNLKASAFHLEVIVQDEHLYFLEVGARVGGARFPSPPGTSRVWICTTNGWS